MAIEGNNSKIRAVTCLAMILGMIGFALEASAQEPERLNASRITAKVPKKLRTFKPYWGFPEKDGTVDNEHVVEDTDCFLMENAVTAVPDWVCWNVDLACPPDTRDKFLRRIAPDRVRIGKDVWNRLMTECIKWAWTKPYGNTNIVCGPLWPVAQPDSTTVPHAFFVAVCKKVNSPEPYSTGFRSVGFIIPNAQSDVPESGGSGKIYNFSTSVNAVENQCRMDLFPRLPEHVEEIVEGMTTYELFCPFQEVESQFYEEPTVELEQDIESFDMSEVTM